MRIDSIKYDVNKISLSIVFQGEIEERVFLQNILTRLGKAMPINCMITDLDTSYSMYEKYFDTGNYYIFDRLTTVTIFAFDLKSAEVQEIISNWGYFTIDAFFALGTIDEEVKKQKTDSTQIFKSLPVIIAQVLDNSIELTIEQPHFEEILKIINTVNTENGPVC